MNEYEAENFKSERVPIVRTPIKTRDLPKTKPALLNKENLLPQPQPPEPRKSLGQNHIRKQSECSGSERRLSRQRKPSLGGSGAGVGMARSGRSERTCHNHPGKPAVFMIVVEDQPLTYCQKCAVMLASQKFKVLPLPQEQPAVPAPPARRTSQAYESRPPQRGPQSRQAEVAQFLEQLQSTSLRVGDGLSSLTRRSQLISNHYEKETRLVQDYYNRLIGSLQRARDQALGSLQLTREKECRLVELYSEQLVECRRQLQNIGRDIRSNYQVIMQEVQEANYRPIMRNYESKREQAAAKAREALALPKQVAGIAEDSLPQLVKEFGDTLGSYFELKLRRMVLGEGGRGRASQTPFRRLLNESENSESQESSLGQ